MAHLFDFLTIVACGSSCLDPVAFAASSPRALRAIVRRVVSIKRMPVIAVSFLGVHPRDAGGQELRARPTDAALQIYSLRYRLKMFRPATASDATEMIQNHPGRDRSICQLVRDPVHCQRRGAIRSRQIGRAHV